MSSTITDADADEFIKVAAQILLRNIDQLGITQTEGSLLREIANTGTETGAGLVVVILIAIVYSLFR